MGFSLLQTPFLQLPLPYPAPHPVPAFLQLDTHLEKDDLTALSRLDALCVLSQHMSHWTVTPIHLCSSLMQGPNLSYWTTVFPAPRAGPGTHISMNPGWTALVRGQCRVGVEMPAEPPPCFPAR